MIALIAGNTASSAAIAQVDRDEQDWRAATAADTCAAYERYLELHPLGRYSDEAFQRAIECTWDTSPPTAEPLVGREAPGGVAASPYD